MKKAELKKLLNKMNKDIQIICEDNTVMRKTIETYFDEIIFKECLR